MGGQDHQVRMLVTHLVDHGGGFPQAAAAADPGYVAGLEQVRVVGHVADHHQRRPSRPGVSAATSSRGCARGGQQDQAAVTEQVSVGLSAVVVATMVVVCLTGISLNGGQTTTQHVIVLGFAVAWLGCVVEPAFRLWGISAAMPRVQRARLRSITLAYGGVIVALVLSAGADLIFGRDRPEITIALPGLAVLPFSCRL